MPNTLADILSAAITQVGAAPNNPMGQRMPYGYLIPDAPKPPPQLPPEWLPPGINQPAQEVPEGPAYAPPPQMFFGNPPGTRYNSGPVPRGSWRTVQT